LFDRLDQKVAHVNFDEDRHILVEQIKQLSIFAEEFSIPYQPQTDPDEHWGSFGEWYEMQHAEAQELVTRLRFRNRHLLASASAALESESVALSIGFKEEISDLIERIRKIVRVIEVDEAKRAAIMNRLAELQLEVDKDKTKFQAAMNLIMEVANTTGKSAEKLDPLMKQVERVAKIFGRAKEESNLEIVQSSDGTKMIEGPEEK